MAQEDRYARKKKEEDTAEEQAPASVTTAAPALPSPSPVNYQPSMVDLMIGYAAQRLPQAVNQFLPQSAEVEISPEAAASTAASAKAAGLNAAQAPTLGWYDELTSVTPQGRFEEQFRNCGF